MVLFFSVFVLVLQPYIREKRMKDNCKVPVDIFKDPLFAYFRGVFDSVLKESHPQGIGIYKKQVEVISPEVEEHLWNEGILDDDTPKKFLDTLAFVLDLSIETYNLICWKLKNHDSLAYTYLIYTESGPKNNSGGVHHRKVQNKSVKVFANNSNPKRCVLQLYQKYSQGCR